MRKIREVSDDKMPVWQLPYCSLIILIVSLFVMLCSYATFGRGRMVEIKRGFRNALILLDLRQLFPSSRETTVVPEESEWFLQDVVAAPLQKFLQGKGLSEEVFLKSTRDAVRLTILDTALFMPGSTQLQIRGQKLLQKIGELLRDVSMPVYIEAHTDPGSEGMKGWEDTALKASTVMNFLHRQCGIPQKRLRAVGFSYFRPFVPNTSLEERRRNRRIDIIVPIEKEFFSKRGGITDQVPPSFKVWDLRQ